MSDKTAMRWRTTTDQELASLDLRGFLEGRNPYGENDNSIDAAFRLGKPVMQEIVTERVGFVNGRVLDLLSGFGRWLPFLADNNVEVVAIERLEHCTSLAARLCAHFGIENVKQITGDISRVAELSDESFDFVWMWSGLQYVERSYALTQIYRVLKPGGRLFVGAYNGAGIMVEHVLNGGERGTVLQGSSRWALSALVRGPLADGNPNFARLEDCVTICERFGFQLAAAAPQTYLDMRRKDRRLKGWQRAPKSGCYFRTIEFLADKPSENN